MLKVVDGAQEARDFVPAQHNGKLLCLTAGGDVVLDNPGPFEGGVVETLERGDRDDDGTGCEVSFLGQVEQINPDLRWPEKVGRFGKMAGEPDDLCDIHTLGVRCQVADLLSSIMRRRSGLIDNSVVRRTAPKGARRIVSQWRCQTRGTCQTVAANKPIKLKIRSSNQCTTAQRFSTMSFIIRGRR